MSEKESGAPNFTETAAESWKRQANEQERKYAAERRKHDQSEVKYRAQRANLFAGEWQRIPEDYPIELVAPVAARLCEGFGYEEAAVKAIRLIQACKRALDTNKADRKFCEQQALLSNDLTADISPPQGAYVIPFRFAISRITRQERFDRAEPQYLAFLQAKHPRLTRADINELWKTQANGIDAAEVEELTSEYWRIIAEGKISNDPPAKKTSKKGFTAKSLLATANSGKKAAKSVDSVAKKNKTTAKRSKSSAKR